MPMEEKIVMPALSAQYFLNINDIDYITQSGCFGLFGPNSRFAFCRFVFLG